MSKPDRIEADPPQAREDVRPANLPRRMTHHVVVDPEDVYPKEVVRRRAFSFEAIVSRYVLLSSAAVMALVVLVLLSLFLLHG